MQITALLGCLLLLTACATNVKDLTRGKAAGTCSLHAMEMQRVLVPIEYGLPAPDPNWEAFAEARERLFPHAPEPVSGGCCVSDDMPFEARIFACSECERARNRWLQAFGER